MEWKEVGRGIATIAPAIAAAIGGPPGVILGGAIKELSGFLGLGDDATPETITEELGRMSPDSYVRLRELDNQYKQQLIDAGIKLEEIAAGDRDSARKREMEVKDTTPKRLAYILIGGFFFTSAAQLVFLSCFPEKATAIPQQGWLLIGTILGYLASESKLASSYYFGTTTDSGRKTELLAQAQPIGK